MHQPRCVRDSDSAVIECPLSLGKSNGVRLAPYDVGGLNSMTSSTILSQNTASTKTYQRMVVPDDLIKTGPEDVIAAIIWLVTKRSSMADQEPIR